MAVSLDVDPRNPGNRTKAAKMRRALEAGQTLQPVDQLWFDEYMASQRKSNGEAKHPHGAKDYGRSRSGRKVRFELEEAAEAEGTGAAATPAALMLQAREEGRRIDALSIEAVNALKEAVAVYKDICLSLRERAEILEATHIEMLGTVRGYYIHAMQAEGALMNKDQEGDPSTMMLLALIAKQLGIDLPAGALPSVGKPKRPPPNGSAQ